MKKLIFAVIVIQHLTLSIQNSFAQPPFSTPDNTGSGNSLEFANGDYVQVGTNASLRPTTALSIMVWAYYSGPGSSSDHIMSNNFPDLTASGYALGLKSGTTGDIQFLTGDCSTTINSLRINNIIPQNEWFHLVATYDGTVKRLYLNGVQIGSQNWSGTICYADNPTFRIGTSYNVSADRSWVGSLDELSIWNRALTQAEIRDNMCQSLVGNELGLVGYWNMNEGTGSTLGDLTSNSNDGTLN